MIVTAQAPATPHVPQGPGRRHRAAGARRDDARLRQRRAARRRGAACGSRSPTCPNGITMADWTPAGSGRGVRVLAHPQAARAVPRATLLVLVGPRAQERQRARRRPGRPRARGGVVSSPACIRKKTAGADIQNGISVDQIAAQHLGSGDALCRRSSSAATTRAPSATATPATAAPTPTASRGAARRRRCRPRPIRGSSSSGCSATSTPRCDPETRARRQRSRRSILDLVARAHRGAGRPTSAPSDRRKIDEYLSSIREIERRIADGRAGPDRSARRHREADRHPGRPTPTTSKLMFDLQVVAFQADLDPRRHDDDGARRQHAHLSRRSACPTRITR